MSILLAIGMETRGKSAQAFTGAIAVGNSPGGIGFDPGTQHVFVTNSASDTVTMIDAVSGTTLKTISVIPTPIQVLIAPKTHRAFVLDDASNLSLLDTRTGSVLREENFSNLGVCNVTLDETLGRVYVTTGAGTDQDTVTVLDARTGKVLQTLVVGPHPHALAVDPRTHRLFVVRLLASSIRVFDRRGRIIAPSIPVGHTPQAVAVDSVARRVFIANTTDGTVSIIDADSLRVIRTVKMGIAPANIVVDEHTHRAFVVGEGGGTFVLDSRTGTILRSLVVGMTTPGAVGAATPNDLVLDQQHGHVFVINNDSDPTSNDGISVLDSRTGGLIRHISVGSGSVAIALDQATGRVFVANRNGGGFTPDWAPAWLRHLAPWLPAPASHGDLGSMSVVAIDK